METSQLRWMAVVPAAIIVYILGMSSAFLTMDIAMSYCPPTEVVSGMCVAPWYDEFMHRLLCIPALLSGFTMVLLPSLVAPELRRLLGWVFFAGGGVFSIAAAFAGFHLECFAALTGGLVAMLVLHRNAQRSR